MTEKKKQQTITHNYDQRLKALEEKIVVLEEIQVQNSIMLNGMVVRLYNLDTKLNEKETRPDKLIVTC